MAQSVEHLTLAQVMISWSVSSSTSGSVMTAQSLEPVSDSVSPSLSVSLSLSQMQVVFLFCFVLFFKAEILGHLCGSVG